MAVRRTRRQVNNAIFVAQDQWVNNHTNAIKKIERSSWHQFPDKNEFKDRNTFIQTWYSDVFWKDFVQPPIPFIIYNESIYKTFGNHLFAFTLNKWEVPWCKEEKVMQVKQQQLKRQREQGLHRSQTLDAYIAKEGSFMDRYGSKLPPCVRKTIESHMNEGTHLRDDARILVFTYLSRINIPAEDIQNMWNEMCFNEVDVKRKNRVFVDVYTPSSELYNYPTNLRKYSSKKHTCESVQAFCPYTSDIEDLADRKLNCQVDAGLERYGGMAKWWSPGSIWWYHVGRHQKNEEKCKKPKIK